MTKCTTGLILCLLMTLTYAHDSHSHHDGIINAAYFNEAALVSEPSEIACTLNDGTESRCLEIVVKYQPDDLEIGPFCPENISQVGGIWYWDGDDAGLYRLNEAFWTRMQALGYHYYDEEGNITIIDPGVASTAGPPTRLGSNAQSVCLQATPDISVEMTTLIPLEPSLASSPTQLGTVAHVGLALNGTPIFADAPSAQTGALPALDTCGGHTDPGGWYHWHATASDIESVYEHEGIEADCALEQSSSALFGYALDGFPIYGSTEADGSLPHDLDACNGHVGITPEYPEGIYHYHASLEFPNLPSCLVGVSAENAFRTTASQGIGSANQANRRPPPMGIGTMGMENGAIPPMGQAPDFTVAARELGVDADALRDALGFPPNFAAAAQVLGVSVERLQEVLPPPPR